MDQNQNFFNKKKILVTGGAGFLGNFLVERLKILGADVFVLKSKKECDLRIEKDIKKLLEKMKPDVVIHLAVDGGGINYMKNNPGSIFYNNLMMNTLLIEQCRKMNIKKFIGIGTVCSYPKFTKVPFREKDLWQGYPEETNAPYGLAKKMMLVQSQAYKEQYNFNAIHLLLTNLYGPKDDFNLESSHVIPALIRKFLNAKEQNEKEVVVWGSGKASREFLYVEDAAEAIILATEKYDKSDPVNIGSRKEISIKKLVQLIAKLVDYKGKIVWDKTKPDGQPRRYLDTSKARNEFGFESKTNIEEGLKKTIEWYNENKSRIENK